MVEGKCALCKKHSTLKKSHIVPKFVGKWLKKTSATGFLRGVKEPYVRMQDLPRLPLLCGNCEQLFSKLEHYFAAKVFHPILDDKKEEIQYDENLHRFIISLSWRTLVTAFSDQVKVHPWIEEHINKAEETWRRYLLNESKDIGETENHLFYLGFIENDVDLPRRFQWYLFRAVDSTLASNEVDIVFSYTHFPHFFFISTILPSTFPEWKYTKIENNGKFSIRSQINDDSIWDFLVSRGKFLLTVLGSSADPSIIKAIEKDPEKFLKSDSFLVMKEESKRRRRKRINEMPESIRNLIGIVDHSADNPELDSLKQRWAYYLQHVVADALSNIPQSSAVIIDQLIQSVFVLIDERNRFSKIDFETKELIARFMVTLGYTKNEQRQMIEGAIDELKNGKNPEDHRIIVVFSFNPLDPVMPYETGYYAD